jgi:hypothetical protein
LPPPPPQLWIASALSITDWWLLGAALAVESAALLNDIPCVNLERQDTEIVVGSQNKPSDQLDYEYVRGAFKIKLQSLNNMNMDMNLLLIVYLS